MVFANIPSSGDGLNDSTEPQKYTSRRELREAERVSLAATSRVKKPRTKSVATRTAPSVPSAHPSAYPSERVLVVVRPAKARAKRKRGSGILTVFAVVGLFGSVALPAAALAPKPEEALTSVTAESRDAALLVAKQATSTVTDRGQFSATTATDIRSQRNTSLKSKNYEAYFASGARELGDDYPYFSELSNNQGGGLSQFNYFYRECVDFVAWRLNRDAGSLTAPYLYDWSYLTPGGGNGSQWKSAWKNHGWATSTTPIAGSVAYFGGENHVAYVKTVNADGTVTLEEYNWQSDHLYGQRTIPSSEVELFLYPPPR